jgi:hypothetical protein
LYQKLLKLVKFTEEYSSHGENWADVSDEHTAFVYREAIKMEAVCSSEMLVSTYKSIQHYNPEDQH